MKTVVTDSLGKSRWADRSVAGLLLGLAAWLVWQSHDWTEPDKNTYSLPHLFWRARQLAIATDEIARDDLCIPTSAILREVNEKLAADARVFGTGLLGPEAGRQLGNLYISQYHLFPRHISISLGGPPRFRDGWMEGQEMASVEQLLTLGFDLLLGFEPTDAGDIGFMPLTAKGEFEFRQ